MTIEMLDGADQAPEAAAAAPKTSDKETALALRDVTTDIAKVDAVAEGLAELKKNYMGLVFDVSTTKGMTEAKAARLAVREPRYAVQAAVTAAKRPLEQLKKRIAARGEEIIQEILLIETPIHEQIQAEEKRKADAKAEQERIEAERVAAINARVEYFAQVIVANVTASAADIQKALEEVEAKVITLDDYAERAGEAEQAKRGAVETLGLMLTQRKAVDEANAASARAAEEQRQREEEQRVRDEAARVEREKAEAAERERTAAAQKKLDEERAAFQREQEVFREEQRKAAERAEAEKREKDEQQARWRHNINALRGNVAMQRTSSEIEAAIERAKNKPMTAELFGDLLAEAIAARDEVVQALQTLLEQAKAREEEERQRRKQREAEEAERAAEDRRMAAASANAVKLLEVARRVRPAFDGGTDDIHSVMTALDAIIAKIDAEAA